MELGPAIWLRDNCSCAECRDPRNGQKLYSITDLPADVTIDQIECSPSGVTVTFGPERHVSVFAHDWPAESGERRDGRTEADKSLWRARDLAAGLPAARWADYRHDDSVRLRLLRQVQDLGFGILTGTPVRARMVLEIAATFGYVRTTNYGELFDVRVAADPTNLAFTGLAIAPHTDNPYRDPVPTMQLLHCLSNTVDGGESGLIDGFRAAGILREEQPAAFDILTRTLVSFAWSDRGAALRAERPLIEVDPLGRIRSVRFNNRSMQAVRLPPTEVEAFYEAYRHFAELLRRPDLPVSFRLNAGDCLIFDNVRLLHSRTAFSENSSGSRHLQGCYADLDGLASTISTLTRSAP